VSIPAHTQASARDDRPHGQVVGEATDPMGNDCQVTIARPCRAVLIRRVEPDAATMDLACSLN
jgi:hypothetical protein